MEQSPGGGGDELMASVMEDSPLASPMEAAGMDPPPSFRESVDGMFSDEAAGMDPPPSFRESVDGMFSDEAAGMDQPPSFRESVDGMFSDEAAGMDPQPSFQESVNGMFSDEEGELAPTQLPPDPDDITDMMFSEESAAEPQGEERPEPKSPRRGEAAEVEVAPAADAAAPPHAPAAAAAAAAAAAQAAALAPPADSDDDEEAFTALDPPPGETQAAGAQADAAEEWPDAQQPAPQAAAIPAPASPPPPPPPPPRSEFEDESRYMQGPNGERLHKWKVDYANRDGAGRAMCRDLDCLERHEQAGVRVIEKGALRIGRRVLMEKDGQAGSLVIFWHHARCIFNTFLRARKSTRVIQSPEDLEGFGAIDLEDQEMLKRFISGNEDVRGAKTGTRGKRPGGAAEKRGPTDRIETVPEPKKPRKGTGLIEVKGRRGERVWTFCRVRAPDRPGIMPMPGAAAGVKSAKPELGMIVEEEKDGSVVVQFESEDHEKERLERYQTRVWANRKSWLRYPRIFEGKKQRIPVKWIQWNRPPPTLCSCKKQEWSHPCDCGISCSRGFSKAIWGVGQ